MLRVSSLFLGLTTPVTKFVQDIFDFFGNYFVTEDGNAILTEDNLYIEVEENT